MLFISTNHPIDTVERLKNIGNHQPDYMAKKHMLEIIAISFIAMISYNPYGSSRTFWGRICWVIWGVNYLLR